MYQTRTKRAAMDKIIFKTEKKMHLIVFVVCNVIKV